MATNLIQQPPTHPVGYAMLSPATRSYDINLFEIRQGFHSRDNADDTTTMVNMTWTISTSAVSVTEWTSGLNETTRTSSMSDTQTILVSMILGIIIVFTITGNFLVVASILVNAHLRTTTNYFIANLAIADLLLGTTVLPFSASLEMLQYWAFGQIFCNVWAAIDVLCCTASILSLCVISIDRYIGVTRPLQHPSIMGHKRALYVIVGVWVLSGIISVAPLIGWKEEPDPNPQVCTVTQHAGYVLFSTALSFYIPCLILLLVYYRIYRKTVAYTKCIMAGGKMTKVDEENTIVLRIHTGNRRSSSTTSATATTTTTTTSITNNTKTTTTVQKSYYSHPAQSSYRNNNVHLHNSVNKGYCNGNGSGKDAKMVSSVKGSNQEFSPHGNAFQDTDRSNRVRKKSAGIGGSRVTLSSKVAKFKREKKAAKTLGIVVGVFITCWLPFFFILPLQSLCASCEIPPLMFKLIFWLGYCNSTMNPIIYTCSSTEFRRAFQSILFCQKCRRRRRASTITTKVKLKPTASKGTNYKGNKGSSRTLCSSFEFGDVSSGSSKFATSSVSSSCFHRQVNETTRNGNGKNTSSQKSPIVNRTDSELTVCDDCKTICQNGTNCNSQSMCCNSTPTNSSLSHNNHSLGYQRARAINQNQDGMLCMCCQKNILVDNGVSMSYQSNSHDLTGLPSSCDISMASLSCHSSSPTLSSSGHERS